MRRFLRQNRAFFITILVLILLVAPIPCKRAVDLETVPWEGPVDLDALVGREVTLLCCHTGIATTDPDDDYFVLGLEADGVMQVWDTPWESKDAPLIILTVTPSWFVGYGIRACYEAGTNRFRFRGVLDEGSGRIYHLRLSSWDVAAPVCRPHPPRYIPRPSYCERWLFPIDFWYPNPYHGLL